MFEKRMTGVLLHITSLPSDYGVGDLGINARLFIDRLSENGVGLWQVLPIGPTGFGDSPYAARSAFAGNEILISPEELVSDGLLGMEDLSGKPEKSDRVDYYEAKKFKLPILFKAARAFLNKGFSEEYFEFKKRNSAWLKDYSLFQSLTDKYNDSRWFSEWPEDIALREPDSMRRVSEELCESVEIYSILQYFFRKQWFSMKKYAESKKIKIIGDIPMFMSFDSSDAWSNRNLLKISSALKMEKEAGVPPDAFSETGQLWGNPVYRWSEHRKDGYAWWVSRFKENLNLFDMVRVDHFRGFSACWEVPGGSATAKPGKWVKSPGKEIFAALKKELGDGLPIIAEDLGVITDDVVELRDSNGFPGMRIFQFAFGFNGPDDWQTDNLYLPHEVIKSSVYYTGTHDNDTTLGWFRSLDEGMKDYVRRYLECSDEGVVRASVRALMMSPAGIVIFPMQDILGLGSEARMNYPSTCGPSNWSWKMDKKDLDTAGWGMIKYYSHLYGRDA